MPWLLFSEPIVKQKEWDAYEVSGTMSNVLVHETIACIILYNRMVVWRSLPDVLVI